MCSEKAARWLRDIIEQAEKIAGYIDGYDEAAFGQDHKTVDAVERCLQRLTEAAIRVRDNAPEHIPSVPESEWHEICATGNRLRHEYEVIDLGEIWKIAAHDVPALADACRAKLNAVVADMD